jgi:hypothetical protein
LDGKWRLFVMLAMPATMTVVVKMVLLWRQFAPVLQGAPPTYAVGLHPMAFARLTDDTLAMKNQILLFTFLSIAAFAAGCDKQQTTAQQIDKVQTETKQAAQDMKDYTFAQKAEFIKAMQAQLTTLDQDLDRLSAKIDSSSDATKAEAKPKLQALRDQAASLNQQLADASNATESTWDSVKAGSQKAYDALAKSFAEARQWVSDKIAP